MVLTSLYESKDLLNKKYLAFFMGLSYSIIGIFFSLKLFPEDPGIVAVVFTSLMALTVFNTLSNYLNKYNNAYDYFKDLFQLYFFLFLGVFCSFLIFSFILPEMATTAFFKEQMRFFGVASVQDSSVAENVSGAAIAFNGNMFYSILKNNATVYLFCFIVSFFMSGGVFLILWNASVWATIFGYVMRSYSHSQASLLLISVLPHTLLEISAYIFAVVIGTSLSTEIMGEGTSNANNLNTVLYATMFSIGILILAAFVEVL